MKRFLAVFLMLAILLTSLTLTASAATTGWVQEGSVWHYVKADGTMVTDDWLKDGGKWYYFNGTAMVEDDWMCINEKYYGFKKGGAMAADGWFEAKFYGNGGDPMTEWFYAGADGAFISGWKQVGGKWYYFAPTTGTWTDEETGETYTWKQAPYMYSNGVYEINKKDYAFKKSGEMVVGWYQPWLDYKYDDGSADTNWVYANADGSLAEGWKKIDGKWYYFWLSMVRDEIVPFVNGKPSWESDDPTIYVFKKSGEMAENGWYEYKWSWTDRDGVKYEGSEWYYLNKDGAAKKGWLKDGGKWYYLDSHWAYMWSDGMWTMSDGKTYAFKKNGEMVTGWYQFDDVWYYFKDSGARAEKEWIKGKDGKTWFYVKEGGAMARNETLTIDGKEYTFGDDGAMK